MLLLVAISILLIWFWTGVYTATTAGFTFHGAATQVYGSLGFWALLLLTVIICLLPRFSVKAAQKLYFPRDVDIIREQIRLGTFDYLKTNESLVPPPPEKVQSLTSSLDEQPEGETKKERKRTDGNMSEDLRPIYPPSVAPTTTTHNRTQNGSDGTDYTNHSIDQPAIMPAVSREMSRPSFDRARMSMDRIRPSFEQSSNFTSASRLMRLESSQSGTGFRWARRLTRASEAKSEGAKSTEE
jgi:phospholipid-translocating ATPase